MNFPSLLWSPVPALPRLHFGDVHVWCAALDAPAVLPGSLDSLLSADERRRAQRLRSATDRQRFITARGLLREILASYLAVPPDDLRFTYGPAGKPRLVAPAAAGGLQFNLSHCGAVALFAITRDQPVGVDLEQIRPLPEMSLIARRYFPPAESRLLQGLEPGRRREIFFQLWTQKEALAKARGVGLAEILESSAATAGRRPAVSPWVTIRLHPATGYTAALALSTPHPRLHCRQWVTRLFAGTARRLADCA